jgi:hypothetical protein
MVTENKKIEDADLQEIEKFQSNINQLLSDLGSTEFSLLQLNHQQQGLESQKAELAKRYHALVQEEQTMFAKFRDKYGEGEFDLKNGIFIQSQKQ